MPQAQTQRQIHSQSTETRQSQQIELKQKLTPMQREAVRLLRLQQIEFEQDVRDHLDSNLALDEYADDNIEDGSGGAGGDDYGREQGGADGPDYFDSRQDDNEDNPGGDDVLGGDDMLGDEDMPAGYEEEPGYGDAGYDDGGFDDDEYGREKYGEQVDDYMPDDRPYYYEPDDRREFVLADTQSIYDDLKMQAATFDLTDKQQQLLDFLINSLDDDGLLRKSSLTLMAELRREGIQATKDEIDDVRSVLKQFEPAGIGAKDLNECLIIQVRCLDKDFPLRQLTLDILGRSFSHFEKKHYDDLASRHKVDRAMLDKVYAIVSHLNPRPADIVSGGGAATSHHIIPDFEVREEGDSFVVSLCQGCVPHVYLNKQYADYVPKAGAVSKQAAAQDEFVRKQVDEARLYIDAINQRHKTMLDTMRAIVAMQPEYFRTGDKGTLNRMIEKDIADKIGRDASTVSGVVSNKYADTPFGIIKLSDLFNRTFVNKDGDDVSRDAVKDKMRALIDAEDKAHPLTDEQLAAQLNVSRRTVTKYRKKMNIPKAGQRR